ncbi:hypothetical protein J3D45_000677 [Microbacterium foliorum]|uniref:hypothetical protein n=1 Tax=Microbacterium foliorum TaxID=104336 RepID=UPI00209FA29A|nr:hypothetical protein [Microbacterium foliorum]MCP1428179.1 hypothetical protein [Microbacterium foliorum]
MLAIDPLLEALLPTWPLLLRYLLGVVVGALLLEFAIATILGVPRVQVRWFVPGDPKPLNSIDIATTRRAMASGPFTVKVLIPPTGLLGRWSLRKLLLPGLVLRVKVLNAPLRPFVDDSDEYNEFPTVTPNDETRGFDIDLGSALPRVGEWRWAEVRWDLTHLPENSEFIVDYEWDHPRKLIRRLIIALVRKPDLVETLRVIRK